MTDYIISFDVGSINMAYCVMHVKTLKIVRWGLFSIKDSTHEGSCTKLVEQLDSRNLLAAPTEMMKTPEQSMPERSTTKKKKKKDEVTDIISTEANNHVLTTMYPKKPLKITVVIELQPRCNAKTILISGQLQMYFVLQKMKNNVSINKIVGYHAKNKIKYYIPREGDGAWPKKIDDLKKGHYKTKKTLEEHCRRILVHNNEPQEIRDFFENSKKQDDISDSYVQSLSYIKTNKLG